MSAQARVPSTPSPELLARLHGILAQVADPEIPVLSVLDLGVIRHFVRSDGRLEVGIAPTYSGCPASTVIKADVLRALAGAGFDAVAADVLAPPWSSDWLSDAGRRKLEAFGIAPPEGRASDAGRAGTGAAPAACPRCRSVRTTRISEFGSTPCKALYRCESCLEPFDYFKCI